MPFPAAVLMASPRRAVLLLLLALCAAFLYLRSESLELQPSASAIALSGLGSARQQDEPGVIKQPASEGQQDEEGNDRWGLDWMARAAAQQVKEKLGWIPGSNMDYSYRDRMSGDDSFAKASSSISSSPSSDLEDPDGLLVYRKHLEKAHSPHGYAKHSPTVTFGHIYVLSLSHRTDRRSRMRKIAHALGLQFTFVDATSKDSALIGWIAERVKEIREKKRPILAKALGKEEGEIGGMGVDSMWLKDQDVEQRLKFPDLTVEDERWTIPAASKAVGDSPQTQQRVVDWVTYLETTAERDSLTPSSMPSSSSMNVSDLLWDPLERLPARQVNDGVIATWYSQTRVWKKIIESNDSSALILEDDIDVEWDIERTWPNVARALPEDWEVVFLGHCWGKELARAVFDSSIERRQC